MTVFALINKLHAKGIELRQENGQLKLKAPKGALTDDLHKQLVSNKSDIIAFLQDISATNQVASILPASRTEEDGHPIKSFPLSFAQERLWFIDQLEPDSAGYNIPAAVTINGELNVDHLEQAFNLIIARHDNLRTIFPSQGGQAQQVILDNLDFKLQRIDLSHHKNNDTRHQKARQLCQTEAVTAFDLAKGPLIRGKLLKLAEQEHILMLTMHHIISDGWSTGVMIKEFGLIMDCLKRGGTPDLPPLPIQYVDYSVWQRKRLAEEGLLEKQLTYWQAKLTGVPESLNLATDYPRQSMQSFAGDRHGFRFHPELASQLRTLTEQQGCTLFMTLLAAFKVLLYRYTGQEDICLGSPIANRQYGETEGLIGMFVNTLALRSFVEGEESFLALLSNVKTTCLDAYAHQDAPFEKVVDLVQPGRNMAISPLFQVMFVLQNTPKEATKQYIKSYPLDNDISKFDLTMSFSEGPEGLEGSIEYKTSLYKPQTIERLADHFRNLCQAVVAMPTAKINQLEFIGGLEKRQLTIELNQTQAGYPKDKCIHQLFVEQVAVNPDQVAAVYQDETLSYQQLYDESYELALYLQSLGVEPDSLVGICVERSLHMIVGMMGILRAGGAYVPLDPDYPEERLAYMLQDSRAKIVLTQKKLKEKLNSLVVKGTKLLILDQDKEIRNDVDELKDNNVELLQKVTPNHLAYVIYTSGSTGQPKGVMVEHKAAVNTVSWFIENFKISEASKLIQLTDYTFDPSVEDIFGSLISRATLYIPSTELLLDESRLVDYIREKEISGLNFVPGILKGLLCDYAPLENIEFVISGGEKLDETVKNSILEKGYRLYNNYGPTEATIDALSIECTEHSVVIGNPIANTQVYILDQGNNPVPVGVPGELHIAGDGLARGYLNRPELTQEKFILNQFNPSTRMYKSGDLVRWIVDSAGRNAVEYLGRIDTQVKIRGFRIETGEIESQLNQYPQIKDSVVVAQGLEANKKLIAFYVANESVADKIVDIPYEELKAHLQKNLPEYMLPAAFVSLEVIPLTSNGKVDRKALESLNVSLESSQTYLAPRNATEKQLVAIWADILDIVPENIGVNDNFFELGGHSLLATQLISRIRSQLAIDLPLKALFEQSNIAGFALLVAKAETNKVPPILPVKRIDEDGHQLESFPLSFAQERLWFIDQLEPNSAGYNMPGAVTISGELDIERLKQVFNLIIARHENLRTIFPCREGHVRQVILNHLDFNLNYIDLSHHKSNEVRHQKAKQLCRNEAATPFDLSQGPLIRAQLIKLTDQEHILMLNMHHIVSDGWSMSVFIKEFSEIMDCLRQGELADLMPLPIQYVDYSVWQRKLMEENCQQEGLLPRQLDYWQEKLAGVSESLDLVTDYPRPSVQDFAGSKQNFRLDSELTSQLKNLTEQQGCTLFMTLLTAFKVLLYRYTGQEDICLGSPIANRHYEETEGLIGMFVNTLALRSQVEGEASFISLLAQVKTTCLEAYEYQDTPFEKIVDLVQPVRDMAVSPLFQIMFELQNTPEEALDEKFQSYPFGSSDISKFDLTMSLIEGPHGLEGSMEYRTSLYKPQTIKRLVEHFRNLCQAIVAMPTAKINQLEFIGESEKQQLQMAFNQTQADYPKDKCIHQLFVEQVAVSPDQIAVVYQDEALSYRQLYDKSYTCALYLQSLGVKPDTLVGLCVERSVQAIVGMLGILQAGGAYVPLAPEYPDERLKFMLEDSQFSIVLTQQKLRQKLSKLITKDTQLVALDQQWAEISDCVAELRSRQVELSQEAKSEDLAYVIYTSGSTGQPKGVMVEHRAVVNTVSWFIKHFNVCENSKLIQLTDYTFDPSVEDIFGALLTGAMLHIPSKDLLLDESELVQYIRKQEISGLNFVPGILRGLLCDYEKLESIEFVISGGEKLDDAIKNEILGRGYHLHNNYGPTETTVDALSGQCTQRPVAIGNPIANTQIYILDQHDNPVPIGVPGELHIAGDGLARGYLNRPELTAEKFILNPFDCEASMYRSGDLARWLDDGSIEYLGRKDTQVKIRGFRIETGEIETHLNQHAMIKSNVVIAQGQEVNKRLIAFYVAEETTENETVESPNEALKTFLQKKLPEYMVPAAFVSLEAIPLTSNGKVDRRALENMSVCMETSQDYLAPRNTTENLLVNIWAEVLDLAPQKIGVNDNFFELGGHSLLAVKLMAKINTQFNQSLPLAVLFSAPSTAALAKLLLSKQVDCFDVLVPMQTKGDKTPIFAVPGAGGNVLSFQALCHALGDGQPFYGLQAVGLDGKTSPLDSVEKTAEENISALKSVQPTGPYRLIGHSYGGVVAFEMARILLQQNEKIASLIMLDSFAPSTIQSTKTLDEIKMLFEVSCALANLYGLNLNLDIKQLKQVSKSKRSDFISSIFNSLGVDITEEQFTTFYNVFSANNHCYDTYRPSKLSHDLDVFLYRASERHHDEGDLSSDYGWNQWLRSPIQKYDVKANHFSMLDKNHVQQIVKMIGS